MGSGGRGWENESKRFPSGVIPFIFARKDGAGKEEEEENSLFYDAAPVGLWL